MRKRYLEALVEEDLRDKMVFLGGARQVGKTTLARVIANQANNPVYLNWDRRSHRRRIMAEEWSPDADLLILDEIHKSKDWKSMVKGIWDTRPEGQRIIVTGSSRLDTFRRGGDSLQGRYHYYRLHPFSSYELSAVGDVLAKFPGDVPDFSFPLQGIDLDSLLAFGGFPEPCLARNKRNLKRWHRQRFESVFRVDIRESEQIKYLSQVELLGYLLPKRVGAPLSFASLVDDIEISPKTIKAWLELLCRNYYIFRVPPYSKRLERALKKESKYYLWDWSEVQDPGARFENMVASHLLKYCHFFQDAFGGAVELHYLRDLEKREVDFLVTWEGAPWLAVEAKLTAGSSLRNLRYFAERLRIDHRYVVTLEEGIDHIDRGTGIRWLSASRFLMALV